MAPNEPMSENFQIFAMESSLSRSPNSFKLKGPEVPS